MLHKSRKLWNGIGHHVVAVATSLGDVANEALPVPGARCDRPVLSRSVDLDPNAEPQSEKEKGR